MSEKITVLLLVCMSMMIGYYIAYKIAFNAGVHHGKNIALQMPASEELENVCLSLWASEENKKFVQRGLSNGK
jgi:hypothetical protein